MMKVRFSMLTRLAASMGMYAACMSTAFAANIIVSTTADELNNNGQCSLREAVAYVNNGTGEDVRNTSSDCHPSDNRPTTVIELKGEETYALTQGEIALTSAMTIRADNYNNTVSNPGGLKQPVVSTKSGRIFKVDDGVADQEVSTVNIQGIEMRGQFYGLTADDLSGQADRALGDGGIILNRERLTLNTVRLIGGGAIQGGAIYNASTDSLLDITSADFFNNFSNQGAALYSEEPRVTIKRSLVRQNKPLKRDAVLVGFAVEIANPGDIDTNIPADSEGRPHQLKLSELVTNTIFYRNDLGVMTIKPGMLVNNITAVENRAGLSLEAVVDIPSDKNPSDRQVIAARLANSVIFQNREAYDLEVDPDDETYVNHLVVQEVLVKSANSSTTTGELVIDSRYQSEVDYRPTAEVLIAENPEAPGECSPPSTDVTKDAGIFCPLIRLEEEFLSTLKPRLLMSYEDITDSPIVNRGIITTNSSSLSLPCVATDIRGEARTECDLGAFELVIDKANSGARDANAEIVYGEVATIDLKDVVGDGQLVPASFCSYELIGREENEIPDAAWPEGKGNWLKGCLLYTSESKVASKGKLRPDVETDKLIYTPSSNYHGLDRFEYEIVTTTSRFSNSANDRNLRVSSQVKQDPPDNFQSETIDGLGFNSGSGGVGSGMLSLLSLLASIALWRRKRDQVRNKNL